VLDDVTQINVLVVDRERTFAEAIAARLQMESDIDVVGVAQSVLLARHVMAARRVDVLLLDADLPGGDDLLACADTFGRDQSPCMIMLSGPAEAERILAALRAGAAGWVGKSESIGHLLRVVSGVTRGETWVPPSELGSVLRLLFDQQNGNGADDPLAALTTREREVLAHMANGAGRKEIAERLHVSPNTVRSHMQSLMGKLGAHSALEAVALAGSCLGVPASGRQLTLLTKCHSTSARGARPAAAAPAWLPRWRRRRHRAQLRLVDPAEGGRGVRAGERTMGGRSGCPR
jgi:DNA-binding NarL/FixJ family response regulator